MTPSSMTYVRSLLLPVTHISTSSEKSRFRSWALQTSFVVDREYQIQCKSFFIVPWIVV